MSAPFSGVICETTNGAWSTRRIVALPLEIMPRIVAPWPKISGIVTSISSFERNFGSRVNSRLGCLKKYLM